MGRWCAFALGLSTGAFGLRKSGPAQEENEVVSPPGSFRQKLRNNVDMQYLADVQVGGQLVSALPDTGSYNFVIFGRQCKQCDRHGAYNSAASSTFVSGPREREQNYGSGTCVAQDGRDRFAVGPFNTSGAAVWEAIRCNMPLLKTGGFDAVVGLGPPGYAKRVALNMLDEIRGMERKYRRAHTALPEKVVNAKKMFEEDVLDDQSTLLESIGVTTISICFGRAPHSPGWLVWNDVRPASSMPTALFSGSDWSSRLTDARLVSLGSDPVPLGCTQGPCHAVLDSGSSLIGVPTSVYEAVLAELNRDDSPDCSDLSKFPELVFYLGGNELRLPPEAYLGVLEGKKSELVARFLRSDGVGSRPPPRAAQAVSVEQCQLLLLDNGNVTSEDGSEELVLGAPFFREYYTTFDLGRPMQGQERKIYVTPAGDQCQPAAHTHKAFSYMRERGPVSPRRIDASQLRLPSRWLMRLF